MMDKLSLRIAVVGAGPAGMYAAGDLLERRDLSVEIDIFERLPTPWGLVRAGVAPDHPQKKLIIDRLFVFHLSDPRVRFFGNINIGTDIFVSDLRKWFHAVIFTVGADSDTKLGIPGEALPGSSAAREFVSFYNGHPDLAGDQFDLSHRRAVIVGNGNVALDIARILTLPHHELARTDIADPALAALASSEVEEVVILGRRGPEYAAYNAPELEEFGEFDSVDVSVAGVDLSEREDSRPPLSWIARRKMEILKTLAHRAPRPGRKRVVFRFFAAPVAYLGDGRVEKVEVVRTGPDGRPAPAEPQSRQPVVDTIETRLVLRACGYRGVALEGLPFDPALGVISNLDGRVIDQHGIVPGLYVAGWIKRGCRGVIGSNKQCARETIAHMLEDFAERRLEHSLPTRDVLLGSIKRLAQTSVSLDGWLRIDRAERSAGQRMGRPRVKVTEHAAQLAIASTVSRASVSEGSSRHDRP